MNYDDFLSSLKNKITDGEYSLVKKALNVLETNECCDEGMLWGNKRVVLPSNIVFKGIWNWDTAFHAVGLSYFDTDFAMEHIEAFLQFRQDDGKFVDAVMCDGKMVTKCTKPPVMAWACQRVYEKNGSLAFLERVYPKLAKNAKFWEKKRCAGNLFHYDAELDDSDAQKKKYVGFDSGWDNSVRWDNEPEKLWAIDLNCFMVMTYRSLAYMAEKLKIEKDEKEFSAKAEILEKLIEENLWNEKLNCYTDRNYETMELSDVLSPASFMPLFIKSAPRERAKSANDVAKEKFLPGMPTVSYDNPNFCNNYWRGPTWLNVAYFAAKGLKNYGFDDTADTIKNTILKWVENDGDCIHENYNALTGEGLRAEKFSWSAVFVIEFILNF